MLVTVGQPGCLVEAATNALRPQGAGLLLGADQISDSRMIRIKTQPDHMQFATIPAHRHLDAGHQPNATGQCRLTGLMQTGQSIVIGQRQQLHTCTCGPLDQLRRGQGAVGGQTVAMEIKTAISCRALGHSTLQES